MLYSQLTLELQDACPVPQPGENDRILLNHSSTWVSVVIEAHFTPFAGAVGGPSTPHTPTWPGSPRPTLSSPMLEA